jgi:hypothetical protein
MMVYYTRSPEYTTCIEDCRARSKGYLRDILTRKIAFLDLAIAFVNKDYGTACPTQATSTARPATAVPAPRKESSPNVAS